MSVLKHCLLLLATANTALSFTARASYNFSQAAIENGDALAKLNADANQAARALNLELTRQGINTSCSADNIQVRKEWRNIPAEERKAFVAAVQCLQASPSLNDPVKLPSAKSLYDDFVITHFNQTANIHWTGTFLLWHRYFTWTYEQKLRTVCGYQGTFPYWEWGYDVEDPAASPLFDGSETSMGSDGAFFLHEGYKLVQRLSKTLINLEPGTGGGCVKSGPFVNMTVHVGPRAMLTFGSTNATSVENPLDDHPRCLKRDLNKHVGKKYSSFLNSTTLILDNDEHEMFQAVMEGDDRFVDGQLGVHGGGHYIIGGDPGSDAFISAGEPVFYLHHAQIDRLYWIWQMLDFANRQGVSGTETMQNSPPSRNVTVEDTIHLTPIGGPVKLKDLMSTVGGSPFCYVYE
ncbi:tyrosinase central domain-containing protein [Colletotrichum truncatum]|uniref:Tyrosinase central domain-containing protein n=1 Tax=Colletotrichum truncatum TaxID=5467 RepID=A0ACC3Z109_COLTU